MTRTERVMLVVFLAAVLSNTIWIEYLLSVNYSAYEFYNAHVDPFLKFLPIFLDFYLHMILGLFVFPALSWFTPFLFYCLIKSQIDRRAKLIS